MADNIFDHSFEQKLWGAINQEMLDGVSNSSHGFHSFCLANVNGVYPESRVVILRDFSAEQRFILLHTDIRSSKCQQLTMNPRVAAVFYDKSLKMQLRFKAIAKIHYYDNLTAERWVASAPSSKRTYLKIHSPGSVISKDDMVLAPQFIDGVYMLDEYEVGKKNFAVIKLSFDSVDVLLLDSKGNKSFRIEWEDNQKIFHHIAP